MGMQISSLPPGGSAAIQASQELADKRPPLPMEKKNGEEQIEVLLPGSKKAPAADIKQTTSDLEHISLTFNRRLKFVIDHDSKEIIIKVIDNETDKVIKVLPPEELQRLHSSIRETIGFLFDAMV